MSVFNIFTLLGGIALFLYGMQMMSEGIERVAGSKMRSILQRLTKNRFLATLVGIGVTAVIQSSSAVTSTVVSFVNAGLLDLPQTVGIIFGAEIGTSVTGQLMAFDIDAVAPLIIAVGVVCYMFIKSGLVKKWAYVVIGFGILFEGLGMMKDSMSALSESEAVRQIIQNTANPILLVLIGIVITAIIQSNSAVTGILITMASSGLISLEGCLFIIIGSNIGACTPAIITSLNGNRDSKRTALIHLSFNTIGTILLFFIILFFGEYVTNFILFISPGATQAAVLSRAVAMANTLFRIFNVVIMFPFANYLVKFTYLLLPKKDHSMDSEDYTRLKFVGEKTPTTPSVAFIETGREIARIGGLVSEGIDDSMSILFNRDEKKLRRVYEIEGYVDELTWQLQEHMVKVTQMEIPVTDERKISGYFHVIIDLERLSDHAENLAEFSETMDEEEIFFSDAANEELKELCGLVLTNVNESVRIFINEDFDALVEFSRREQKIDALSKLAENNHVNRMTKGVCSPKSGLFSDMVSNLERMGDHANNIAYALAPFNLEDEIEEKIRSSK